MPRRNDRFLRRLLTSLTAAALAVAGAGLGTAPARAAAAGGNPFAGAVGYVDPGWAADVESSAAQVDDATARRMRGLKRTPTAVWLDSIAAVTGGPGVSRSLTDHLDAALWQSHMAHRPVYVTLVLYDLPDRDCRWRLSTGELHAAGDGLRRYKTEYVDAIAAVLARHKYRGLRVATIVEPRSLADLVTDPYYYSCDQVTQSGVYQEGIAYALDRLSPLPNVSTYLDAGNAAAAGWDANLRTLVNLIAETVGGTAAGPGGLDGIATDVAGYIPTAEPFLSASGGTVSGVPIIQSRFYDWNPYVGELDYAAALRAALIAKGFSSDLGVVVDTSRDGWGGPDRPTAASTSTDVNTYVDESRVDRRPSRWATICNQNGAGLGSRPVAAPVPGVDAYLWIKRPGESDGASGPTLPPGLDMYDVSQLCDPTASLPPIGDAYRPTNALPDAPPTGEWHHEQFVMLVRNAYPAL
jgi:cellulose 1,4-beta-cellobiosidase